MTLRSAPVRLFPSRASKPRHSAGDELGVFDRAPAFPNGMEVHAVCTRITLHEYPHYRQRKLRFVFTAFDPPEAEGAELELFVRCGAKNLKLGRSSKLWKLLQSFTEGMKGPLTLVRIRQQFLHKAFICRTRVSGEGYGAYSVVDAIMKRLTR